MASARDSMGGHSESVSTGQASRGDVADALVRRLHARAQQDPTYWSFAGNDKRRNGHALFSYPAMMVPQLQGALLDDLISVDPSIQRVYDPFAGSGTVLVESMVRGLEF